MKILLVLFIHLVIQCSSYLRRSNQQHRHRSQRFPLLHCDGSDAESIEQNKKSVFLQLIDSILTAMGDMYNPQHWDSDMDKGRLNNSPPEWKKATTASGWKAKKGRKKAYAEMDIAEDFAKRWMGQVDTSTSSQRSSEQDVADLNRMLEELDKLGMLTELDDYMSIGANEEKSKKAKALADDLQAALAPMKEIFKSRPVPSPTRFYSPVKLSALKRILQKNPEYFKH